MGVFFFLRVFSWDQNNNFYKKKKDQWFCQIQSLLWCLLINTVIVVLLFKDAFLAEIRRCIWPWLLMYLLCLSVMATLRISRHSVSPYLTVITLHFRCVAESPAPYHPLSLFIYYFRMKKMMLESKTVFKGQCVSIKQGTLLKWLQEHIWLISMYPSILHFSKYNHTCLGVKHILYI